MSAGRLRCRGVGGLGHAPGPDSTVVASSPHGTGDAASLSLSGVAGGGYLGFVDDTLIFTPTTASGGHGVRHIVGFGPLTVFYSGLYDASGGAAVPYTVATPPPGAQGHVYVFQALSIDALPIGQPVYTSPSAMIQVF